LLLLPFSYTKLYFHKLIMIYVYSKSYRVSRADKFVTWLVFVVIGIFLLTMNVVVDVWYFTRHMLMKDVQKVKHKTSQR
jgi:hypothetical protein